MDECKFTRMHGPTSRAAGYHPRRSRRAIAIALGGVIAVGLESRLGPVRSSWAGKEIGDTLWAVMFYLSFILLLPDLRPMAAAGTALTVTFAIEFLKLCHSPWLDRLRAQPVAGLLLGHGFYWHDLGCYLLGVMIGVLLDLALRQ